MRGPTCVAVAALLVVWLCVSAEAVKSELRGGGDGRLRRLYGLESSESVDEISATSSFVEKHANAAQESTDSRRAEKEARDLLKEVTEALADTEGAVEIVDGQRKSCWSAIVADLEERREFNERENEVWQTRRDAPRRADGSEIHWTEDREKIEALVKEKEEVYKPLMARIEESYERCKGLDEDHAALMAQIPTQKEVIKNARSGLAEAIERQRRANKDWEAHKKAAALRQKKHEENMGNIGGTGHESIIFG